MPRQSRMDVPGLLHHVMIRGIERKPIFADDQGNRPIDRIALADRLAPGGVHVQLGCDVGRGSQTLDGLGKRLWVGRLS